MGLDVYAGTLTRYYAADWETMVQRAGRELGREVQIERPGGPASEVTSTAEVVRDVARWRVEAFDGLPAGFADAFSWDEGASLPYLTDKPDWEAFISLLLWAAHTEHPELPLAPGLSEDWQQDAALLASAADEESAFPHLLWGAEIWLPARLDGPFSWPDPQGHERMFGSSLALLDELRAVNAGSWRADNATVESWRYELPEVDASIETWARFGYAVLFPLVEFSVVQRVPIILDY